MLKGNKLPGFGLLGFGIVGFCWVSLDLLSLVSCEWDRSGWVSSRRRGSVKFDLTRFCGSVVICWDLFPSRGISEEEELAWNLSSEEFCGIRGCVTHHPLPQSSSRRFWAPIMTGPAHMIICEGNN